MMNYALVGSGDVTVSSVVVSGLATLCGKSGSAISSLHTALLDEEEEEEEEEEEGVSAEAVAAAAAAADDDLTKSVMPDLYHAGIVTCEVRRGRIPPLYSSRNK